MNEQQKAIKKFLETYWTCDISDAVVERVCEIIDTFMDDEVEECPVCGRRFLISEGALQYTDAHENPACDCQSPENLAADKADMEYDLAKESL